MSLLSLFPLRVALLSVAFLLVPSSQCLADFFNPEEKRDSVELTTGQKQAEAQFKLGVKYLEGDGVQQSYEEAVKWFRKAAEQGLAAAQYTLGLRYLNGQGVTLSHEEAVKWFRKSAEQGFAAAQHNLGVMYLNGLGVSQSYEEAIKWFRKSAEQGFAAAQYNLGVMYFEGQGVSQSYKKAVEWVRKAAEQGLAAAQNNLGVMYLNGQGVPQSDMDAARWFRKSAEQGIAEAQCALGGMYATGKGVSQSYERAGKWFRKAAEQGDAVAQYYLASLYAEGQGVEQSYEEANKWYRKAAEQGDPDAQFELGVMYMEGKLGPQNATTAIRWLEKAAEQGHSEARQALDSLKQNKQSSQRPGFGAPSADEHSMERNKASFQAPMKGFSFCGIALGSVKDATDKNDEGYPLYTGKLGQPFRGIDEVRCFLTPSRRQVFGIRLAQACSSDSEMCKEQETIKRLLEIKYGKTPDRVEKNDAQNDDYYWFLEDGTIMVNLDAPTDEVIVLDVISIPLQQKAEEELRQKTLEENAADLKAL